MTRWFRERGKLSGSFGLAFREHFHPTIPERFKNSAESYFRDSNAAYAGSLRFQVERGFEGLRRAGGVGGLRDGAARALNRDRVRVAVN